MEWLLGFEDVVQESFAKSQMPRNGLISFLFVIQHFEVPSEK